MPVSKRDKESKIFTILYFLLVSLTKTKKKTKEHKGNLIEEIRKWVETYPNVFVFSMDNVRGTKFIEIRQHFKSNSRFFYGKNNLVTVALGRTQDDEVAKDLYKVSNLLKGQCGLMFTTQDAKTVRKYFKEFVVDDFARAGTVVENDVELPAGPLKDISGAMEPLLRKLGVPTHLVDSVIELTKDFTICKAGDTLTPSQSQILKLFNIKTSTFSVEIKALWTAKNGLKEY